MTDPSTMSTDNELAIRAMTEWPEEARPEGVYRAFDRVWHAALSDHAAWPMTDAQAISIFEISGLKWLMLHAPGHSVLLNAPDKDGSHTIGTYESAGNWEIQNYTAHDGPTLLSAIDAAIRATTKGRAGA